MQIETQARERVGRATTNFAGRLPAPDSDLARETLKEPYRFDFLGLGQEAQERQISRQPQDSRTIRVHPPEATIPAFGI